ncbi:MAG: ABC transporter substrate-binding protein, partial [Aestuariivirgaceae bacterium]
MIKKVLAAALALGVSATAAVAAEKIKVGVITTLTTPAAVLGNEQMHGFNLALKHLGNKLGGLPVELVVEDDGFKPEIGKQKADKLVKQDNVDVVTGLIWSHVMLASANSVLNGGKFLISANAGHSKMAGKNCHKNFFNTSWQNDTVPMALGEVLNQEGVKSVYIMSPNYAAGKDMAKGVERTFKGEIKGKDFTKWGKDAQLDFSAELAKAKASGAEAIFVFYPGKAGGAFMKQFGQAGLRDTMKLFTVFTVDGISLPKFQKANMTGVLG